MSAIRSRALLVSALALVLASTSVAIAQPIAARSVPATINALHGATSTFWIAQTAGPGAVSWRILSVVGPPGLSVTTSGGNVSTPGAPPTPFETWAVPGPNLLRATTLADAPPRIDTWLIVAEVMDGGGMTASAVATLVVSHGPPLPLPVPPGGPPGGGGGGGGAPGNSWNVECEHPPQAPLVLRHTNNPAAGALIRVRPRPNTPPPPPVLFGRIVGIHPNLGPRVANPGGLAPLPGPFVGVACVPEHDDGVVRWIVAVRIESFNPRRVEIEKCVVVCDHVEEEVEAVFLTPGRVLGAMAAFGLWLGEESGAAPTARTPLLQKLVDAQTALLTGRGSATGRLGTLAGMLSARSGTTVPAASAALGAHLIGQLQAAIVALP